MAVTRRYHLMYEAVFIVATKKNQHYVPKVHLKQFSLDEDQKQIGIWLPANDKIVPNASIRDQCSKAYFYGQDLEVENYFSSPEGIWGRIVKKLATSHTPTKADLDTLLFLWLLQHIRTKRAITNQLIMMGEMREKVSIGQDPATIDNFLGEPMGTPEAIKMVLSSASNLFKSISDLRSVLLINNTKTGFIMSDNPAVSSNKFIPMRFRSHPSSGLSAAGSYAYVPLTPNIGFFAFDRHVYELNGRNGLTCNLGEKDIIHLNQLIYIFSDSVVILPPNSNHQPIVNSLKSISEYKRPLTTRVNIAIKDSAQSKSGSVTFTSATDDEFEKSKSGLIHVESTPPLVPKHLNKLRIRQSPKYTDTKSAAGIIRYIGHSLIA